MLVLQTAPGFALCEGMGQRREVNTWLIDPPAVGDWLLVFIDSAREKLEPQRARQIGDALHGLQAALDGDVDLDRWFPDLAQRAPQLPDFLQSPPTEG